MRKKSVSYVTGIILVLFLLTANWNANVESSGIVRVGVGLEICPREGPCVGFGMFIEPRIVTCLAPPQTVTIQLVGGKLPFIFTVIDPDGRPVAIQPTNDARRVTFVANVAGVYGVGVRDANDCAPCTEAITAPDFSFIPCVSLTQTIWGKAKPKFNGDKRVKTIQSLLSKQDGSVIIQVPLTVGVPGARSLTFPGDSTAQCILDLLPARGTPAALPAGLGDVTVNPGSCDTSPPRGGTLFQNELLGNTIALSLSLRLDFDIDSVSLCKNMTVKGAIPPPVPTSINPKGYLGHYDNRVDPTDPGASFTIPTSVLRAIAAGSPLDVQGKFKVTENGFTRNAPGNSVERVLILANLALGGQDTDGASFADINTAIDLINRGFDRGGYVSSCTFPRPANLDITYSPSPVPQSSSSCVGTRPAWSYNVTVRETAGVGITINGFNWNFYDKDFNLITSESRSANDFTSFFNKCGQSSRFIPANGQACASLCVALGGRTSGIIEMEFFGVDDNGNNRIYRSFPLTLLGQ